MSAVEEPDKKHYYHNSVHLVPIDYNFATNHHNKQFGKNWYFPDKTAQTQCMTMTARMMAVMIQMESNWAEMTAVQ
eukprot:scaffold6215_cov110-Skeletonema_dohrnii-CCMP3373.AAC.3